MSTSSFSPALFAFLKGLKKNNQRDWFDENKPNYEQDVKAPLLAFIAGFGPKLHKISKHFVADARGNGGSMFRIYRDTRFSKDKTPYKTAASAHFRHERAKDVHAPGFYLHLEPGGVFFGAGLWHPETGAAEAVRTAIVKRSAAWKKTVTHKAFAAQCTIGGESLKRPPRGYDADHPFIADIQRKDWVISKNVNDADVTQPGFLDAFATWCVVASPFMRFLCESLDLPY
jgi:uncharacterized protein (TIGR02453 family)